MISVSCLTEDSVPITLDASVIINLNATTIAGEILDSLNRPIFVTSAVVREMKNAANATLDDSGALDELISAGNLETVELSRSALSTFVSLVSGNTILTLGDAEASTLSYSDDRSAIAVVDGRKTWRISSERLPELRLANSIDLFAYPPTLAALGSGALSNALFDALAKTRMYVGVEHVDWVRSVLGAKRSAECSIVR